MAPYIALIFATNQNIHDLLLSASYVSEPQNQVFNPIATAALTFRTAMGIFSLITS